MNKVIIDLHVLLILLAYSSPLWLDWRFISIGVGVYYLQLLVFGWCVLSLKQFHGQKQTFHGWYLAKIGVQPDPKQLRFILNYVIPPTLALVGFGAQTMLSLKPLVRV